MHDRRATGRVRHARAIALATASCFSLLALSSVDAGSRASMLGEPGVSGVSNAADDATVSIVLRSKVATLQGRVLSFSAEGVLLRLASSNQAAADVVVSWDVIRDPAAISAKVSKEIIQRGEDLWRVRTRLERGDYAKAEQLIEPMFMSLSKGTELAGPTGALACESVLRCRLNRGFTSAALEPYFRWRAIQAAAGRVGGEESGKSGTPLPAWIGGVLAGPPVMDAATGLCVQLPPIFSGGTGLRALPILRDSAMWAKPFALEGSTGQIAQLYRRAIAAEIAIAKGQAAEESPGDGLTSKDQAVQLVAEIVFARAGTSAQRHDARTALERRLSVFAARPKSGDVEGEARLIAASTQQTAWQEAWIRAAIGRSLMMESDPKLRRQGLISLLHLPARFGDQQPWLAALALGDAIAELKATNDIDGARKLAQDLQARLGDYATDETLDLARPVEVPLAPESPAGQPEIPKEQPAKPPD